MTPPSTASKGLNFNALSDEGLQLLRRYAADTWTDHNAHDPGITMLEALAYALTELGARAELDIRDLLASSGAGSTNDMFLTGAEVLQGGPLTWQDFQQSLARLAGVRRAWVAPAEAEVPVFFANNQLSLSGSSAQRLHLLGLYDALVQWTEHPTLGDLNSNLYATPVTAKLLDGSLRTYTVEVAYPRWDDTAADPFAQVLTGVVLTISPFESLAADTETVFARLTLKHNGLGVGDPLPEFGIIASFDRTIRSNDERTAAYAALSDVLIAPTGLIRDFNLRVREARLRRAALLSELPALRNLGEDFGALRAAREQEIAVEGFLEIKPGTAAEPLVASLFAQLHQFVEAIAADFQPHSDSPQGVFTSDVLNIIFQADRDLADGSRLLGITGLTLTNYINNRSVSAAAENCLSLVSEGNFIPKFSFRKSRIKVLREGYEMPLAAAQVEAMFKASLTVPTPPALTTPAELRPILPLYDFASVRDDMPRTYRVGTRTGREDLTQPGDALAAQSKAYLLFFDQMLADSTFQLANAARLFSVGYAGTQSWFPANMRQQTPDIAYLLNEPQYTTLLAAQPRSQDRLQAILDHWIARFAESAEAYRPLLPEGVSTTDLIVLKRKFLKELPSLHAHRALAFNYLKPGWDTDNLSFIERKLRLLLGMPLLRETLWADISTPFHTTSVVPTLGFELRNGATILLKHTTTYATQALAETAMLAVIQHGRTAANYQLTGTVPNLRIRLYAPDGQPLAESNGIFATVVAGQAGIQQCITFIRQNLLPKEGFHLLEHILLRPKPSAPPYGLPQLPLDGATQPAIHPAYHPDFYSCQVSIVFPAAGDRLGSSAYQSAIEKTIRRELPAWITPHFYWLNFTAMGQFEKTYQLWLAKHADSTATLADKRVQNNALVNIVANLQIQFAATHGS